MDLAQIADIVLVYLLLLIVVTLHEFGHAWAATKMGDPTPRLQGRLSLNPLAHIDPVGTALLPILALMAGAIGSPAARLIVGWGKPVQVEPTFFRNRAKGEVFVSLAGPIMNLLLALVAILAAKLLLRLRMDSLSETMQALAALSVFLAFFNMLPIPPLDGSHVLKHAVGLRDETYNQIAQWGFLLIVLVINLPPVMALLHLLANFTLSVLMILVGWI